MGPLDTVRNMITDHPIVFGVVTFILGAWIF